jgi:hypothetical protein
MKLKSHPVTEPGRDEGGEQYMKEEVSTEAEGVEPPVQKQYSVQIISRFLLVVEGLYHSFG